MYFFIQLLSKIVYAIYQGIGLYQDIGQNNINWKQKCTVFAKNKRIMCRFIILKTISYT